MRIPSGQREQRKPYPRRDAEQAYDVKREVSTIAGHAKVTLSQRKITVGVTQEVPFVAESVDAYAARLARAARDASKVTPSHYHTVRYRNAIVNGKKIEQRVQESISLSLPEAERMARLYQQTEGRAYAPRFLTSADEDTLVQVRVSACHHKHTVGKFGRNNRLERLVCSGK